MVLSLDGLVEEYSKKGKKLVNYILRRSGKVRKRRKKK